MRAIAGITIALALLLAPSSARAQGRRGELEREWRAWRWTRDQVYGEQADLMAQRAKVGVGVRRPAAAPPVVRTPVGTPSLPPARVTGPASQPVDPSMGSASRAAEARRRAALEAQRKAAEERARRLREAREEAARRAAQERLREAEARRRAAEEAQRKAAEARRRAAEEAQRKAAEARRREEEARRKAEEERRRREALERRLLEDQVDSDGQAVDEELEEELKSLEE